MGKYLLILVFWLAFSTVALSDTGGKSKSIEGYKNLKLRTVYTFDWLQANYPKLFTEAGQLFIIESHKTEGQEVMKCCPQISDSVSIDGVSLPLCPFLYFTPFMGYSSRKVELLAIEFIISHAGTCNVGDDFLTEVQSNYDLASIAYVPKYERFDFHVYDLYLRDAGRNQLLGDNQCSPLDDEAIHPKVIHLLYTTPEFLKHENVYKWERSEQEKRRHRDSRDKGLDSL